MRAAARALLSTQGITEQSPAKIEQWFKVLFYDTGRIFEGVGFYFLEASKETPESVSGDRLRRLVMECALFVEAAHEILAKIRASNPKAA
jgi:hypothetical protein